MGVMKERRMKMPQAKWKNFTKEQLQEKMNAVYSQSAFLKELGYIFLF